jgi:ABC-type transport system involved in multi-copper enzyme maturation permease subunit
LYLFGPVLRYDLVRTARRARYFVMRFFFALVLFLTLFVFYHQMLGSVQAQRAQRQTLIDFAEFFGNAYLIIQFLLVLLMTPAYVGSAISEEKERRTLEFLFATDLRNQEIIFGKLASRVGNILMFLLAGLPVLAFIQFFGGIDPDLLMAGFGATLATVLSISAVSLYCSVHAKHSRDGIVRSYLYVIGYFLLGVILFVLFQMLQGSFAGTGGAASWKIEEQSPTIRGIAWFSEIFLSGDLFHAIFVNRMAFYARVTGLGVSWTGVDLGTSISQLYRNYLIFHGAVFLLFLLASIWQIRSACLHISPGKKKRSKERKFRAVNNWPPMVWKELLVPKLARKTLRYRIATGLVWAVYLVILVLIFVFHFQHGTFRWNDLGFATNIYVRIAGTVLAVLLVLGVGVRAAVAVGVERDKQTLETLLSSVLTDRQIMFGKWVGSLGSLGPSLILLGIIWILGLISGGLSLLAIPILVLCLLVYGSFAASLGLFFSAGGKTTTRALLGTLFWLIVWGGAHLLLVGIVVMMMGGKDANELFGFFLGNTPPFVMGFFSFRLEELQTIHNQNTVEMITYSFMGLALSALLALLFFFLACQRFFLTTGRVHTLDKRPLHLSPSA